MNAKFTLQKHKWLEIRCEYTVSGKWFKYKKKIQKIISKNGVKIKHKLIRKCAFINLMCVKHLENLTIKIVGV